MKTYNYKSKLKTVIILIISLFIVVFSCYYVTRNFRKADIIVTRFQTSRFDRYTLLAIIKAESNFDELAVSDKGAKGLMQLTDATFLFVSDENSLGFEVQDIFDPEKNILVGVCYLEYLYSKFNDEILVLCAYNAGEGRVLSWLKDTNCSNDGVTLDYIPFKETREYVQKIYRYKEVFSYL